MLNKHGSGGGALKGRPATNVFEVGPPKAKQLVLCQLMFPWLMHLMVRSAKSVAWRGNRVKGTSILHQNCPTRRSIVGFGRLGLLFKEVRKILTAFLKFKVDILNILPMPETLLVAYAHRLYTFFVILFLKAARSAQIACDVLGS